jgi:FkbH-like protein
MKLIEIIGENRRLGEELTTEEFPIAILSNITLNQLQPVLEYTLRSQGINAAVQLGDYDNIVQDSSKFKHCKAVIIFWELNYLADQFSEEELDWPTAKIESLTEKIKTELSFALGQLETVPLVLVNRFSAQNTFSDELLDLATKLNEYLDAVEQSNVFPVDKTAIIQATGKEQSFDLRNFFSSKSSFYTVPFFETYCQQVKPIFLSATGKSKKALIFDCDNTLWKGVVGEDGPNGIEISEAFRAVQLMAVELSKQGVILGLNSKNNPEDVAEAFANSSMELKDEHLVIKKVNWNDKASNLHEIAQELNIGLDSLVMVDDAHFEVNLIREQLPEVTVIQVPEDISEYPKKLKNILGLFRTNSATAEDAVKTEMYQQQSKREEEKKGFGSIDDYLASLNLKVTVFGWNEKLIPRISQLTQKTNQFNLTTQRYTENEILQLQSNGAYIRCFQLDDRFGNYGITGLCITHIDNANKKATIDTLLMSCRVIGRNVEYAFFDNIAKELSLKGIEEIEMQYNPSPKNVQVSGLYEKFGAVLIAEENGIKHYQLLLTDYRPHQISYIQLKNDS